MKLKLLFISALTFASMSWAQNGNKPNSLGHAGGVVPTQAVSHEKCGSADHHRKLMATDPQYVLKRQQSEKHYQEFMKNPTHDKVTYTIPVVVHVIHTGQGVGVGANISAAQVQSAIDNLNAAFSNTSTAYTTYTGVNTNIQFCLAQRDALGNSSTGIVRLDGSGITAYSTKGICRAGKGTGEDNEAAVKALSVWDNTKYYNIWVVTEIDDNNAGAGVQGYAQFAGGPAASDGTVILFNSFGYDPPGLTHNLKSYTNRNVTTVHEIGHALNLYHTFEGDDANGDGTADRCPSDAVCGTNGDCVADTPPHQRSNSDCVTAGTNSCNGGSSNSLFVHNFMDYSSDVCQTEFTAGQVTRMTAVMTGSRSSLASSDGCNPVNANDVGIYAVLTPTSSVCGSDFDPVITIKNYGSNTLTSATITYDIDGGTAQVYNWTGSLANNATENVNLSTISGSAGAHTFNVATSLPNTVADDYTANDAEAIAYTSTPPGPTAACTPTTVNSGNYGTGITRVQFGTIDNAHTANDNDGLQDFVCSNYTTVSANSSNAFTIDVDGGTAESCNIYIDFNDNGTFDAGETVYTSGSTAASFTSNIAIPEFPEVTGKILRMRIVTDFGGITGPCTDVDYGEIEDYGVFITTPACVAPTMTAQPSAQSGCVGANASFTVAATGSNPKTYQWQVNTGAGYANVSNGGIYTNATTATLNLTSITAGENGYLYRCVITNGCGSVNSNGVELTAITTATAACTPATTNTGNFGTGIIRVQFNTIDNAHNDGNNDGTQNFVCSNSTTVMPNTSHTLTVTLVNSNPENCRVYIDYNDDGTFAVGEMVYNSASNGSGVHSTSISIPSNPAVTGKLIRMRVISDFAGISGGCTDVQYGELEDYGLFIPCGIPTVSSTTDGVGCGTGTVGLAASASSGTINWYDGLLVGSLVGSGSSFTTPSISSTTAYYAEAVDGLCVSDARSEVTATIQDCSSELAGGSCNTTITTLDQAINSTAVAGATNYRYHVSHPATGFSTLAVRAASDNLFRMSWFSSGIKYGTTYNVKVSAYVGGAWRAYSTVCNITTPATKLVDASCGINITDLAQTLNCYEVAGATNYRYEIRHVESNFYAQSVRGSANTNFRLSWVSGITSAKTYQVRVSAYVGGSWQAYGPACSITTAIPTTQLASGSCGASIPTMSTALYSDVVSGALNYRYKVMEGAVLIGVSTRNAPDNLFRLSWLSGTALNKTYTIYVAVYANGMWGEYGSGCLVTTPAALVVQSGNGTLGAQLLNNFELSAYPNPSTGDFTIHSNLEGKYKVVNELGQVIRTFELSENNGLTHRVTEVAQGMYFISGTSTDGQITTTKVIVH